MPPDGTADIGELRNLLESLLRIEVHRELGTEFGRDPRLRLLFELTGRLTRQEIQKKTRLDTHAIARTWASWQSRGLIKKVGKSYQKVWRE